jgi:hypothetical protein
MPGTLKFDVQLPAWPADSDVVSGELTTTVDGSDPVVTAVAKDQEKVSDLSGPQDSNVTLSFVYIDDAGNRSTNPATLSMVLKDTVPPPDPGTLGLVVTGEV